MPLSAPVTAIAVERSAGRLGRAAAASMHGVRNTFEDALLLDQARGFCAVYDGHLGDEAAAFCAERLHLHVAAAEAEPSRETLLSAFQACDTELRDRLPEGSEAGTTAAFVAVREGGDADSLKVLIANCGDSRAVLFRKDGQAVEATRDHRPGDPEERKRIELAGGVVCEDFDPPRIDGGLACSRALGAFKYKQDGALAPGAQKVSSVPDFYEWTARRGDWLILGCDGVWDVLSNQQVIDDVCKAGDIGDSVARVLDMCIKREADDNLTLMAIELGAVPEEPSAVSVTPGDFLKTKDKEVLQEYASFSLRFGFVLSKEMIPKAPPAAKLEKADPVPGLRFANLPAPVAATGDGKAASAAGGTLQIKVTAKRSAWAFISAARALIAEGGAFKEMEVRGLGNALPTVASVAGVLVADGHEIVLTETSLVEVMSDVAERAIQSPQLRVVVALARSA